MSGIKIAALYGIYPFRLGLCGPQEKTKKKVLLNYLSGKKISEEEIRNILEQFKGAFPYYNLIAKSNGIEDPFDKEVVMAYWIGNHLLDKVSIDSLREMIIKEFAGPGLLLKKTAQKKAKEIPFNSKPHHSFHVFVIGSVTGVIDLRGRLLDICRISWGEVKEKNDMEIIIKYQPIKKLKNKYFFGKFIKKTISWDRDLIPKVEIGDKISSHWNYLVQVLNREDFNNLRKYTQLTLNSLND